MAQILVVDDNPDILDSLDLLLQLHEHEVVCVDNAQAALLAISRKAIDLVIQDMNFTEDFTSGGEGKSLFYQIKQLKPDLPIILMTAWTHLEAAVELVKAGAADYLPKPWDNEKLLQTIEQCCKVKEACKSNTDKTTSLLYRSEPMVRLISMADKVAQSDINALITGPNGSGKEKLTDYIHEKSKRANSPCLKVNIGALPAELMEAELFGAEKGAFTGANTLRIGRFEAANGGTLFLDEIGNLSLQGQMKLLRVLQTGEFERLGSNVTQTTDVRIICATNADLPKAVKQGEFREDLFFRLNVVELKIPPLNQRKADILPLVELFLGDDYQLSSCAKHFLLEYHWPGNVRELQNSCARAKVFVNGTMVTGRDFLAESLDAPVSEKERILDALQQHDWVIKQAAQTLGLSRQSLYRRMDKYDIKSDNLP